MDLRDIARTRTLGLRERVLTKNYVDEEGLLVRAWFAGEQRNGNAEVC